MVDNSTIEDSVPDLGSLDSGEICTGILIFLALFSAFTSFTSSASVYASYYATITITLGLAAIAVAILAAGRRIGGVDSEAE